MDKRKTYLNTDEQADDELSRLPSMGGQGGRQGRQSEEAQRQGGRSRPASAAPGGDLRIGGDAMTKITTGLNDAPEEATIAQSGPGLPDDSSQPVEATEGEALRIQSKLEGTDQEDRKAEADDLGKQLASPKHGTA
jgi:hypothetical protein